MTATGILLIPLGGLLLLMPWPVILTVLPTFALLHGAAVVNLGSIGLQPGYFLALLMIGRSLLEIVLLRQPLNREALRFVLPLGLLLTCSVLVLWLGVAFFEGNVAVLGGTDEYDLGRARAFQFRRENVAQLSYLVINSALVFTIAHQSVRLTPDQVLAVVERGLRWALLCALALCAWQLLAHSTGLWFPDTLLFSNAGYHRADNQEFYGQLRLNGPFTEPSMLAYAFAGFLFYSWKRLLLQPTVLSAALLMAVMACILLSFSTTGYFVLAAGAALITFDLLRRLPRLRAPRLNTRAGAITALMVIAIVGAGAWVTTCEELVAKILDVSLLAKTHTSSFEVRSGAEMLGLQVLIQTGGLGIGLGSHKANSLLMTLLSNVGLVGTAIFSSFVVMLLRPVPRMAPERAASSETPLRFFILGLLLVHMISNPNFNVVVLWAAFGLMAGYRASLAAPRLPAAHAPPPRARRAVSSAAPPRRLALPHRTGIRQESA